MSGNNVKQRQTGPNYALGWTNAGSAYVAMSEWENAGKMAKRRLPSILSATLTDAINPVGSCPTQLG